MADKFNSRVDDRCQVPFDFIPPSTCTEASDVRRRCTPTLEMSEFVEKNRMYALNLSLRGGG